MTERTTADRALRGRSPLAAAALGVGMVATLVACSRTEPDARATSSAKAAATRPPPVFAPRPNPLPSRPPGLPPMPVPEGSPTTPDRVALGRQLFFDRRLSQDAHLACESCHVPGSTTRPETMRSRVEGRPPRRAPSLGNVGYKGHFYWDARLSGSLEAVVRQEWRESGMAPGADGPQEVVARLGRVPGYVGAFKRSFAASGVTEAAIIDALSAYLRTLYCGDTPWDRLQQGAEGALTPAQRRGWDLFSGPAGCSGCHAPPFFSDAYGADVIAHRTEARPLDLPLVDPGRAEATAAPDDRGAFVTPSLRLSPPGGGLYHDGAVPTLDAAVSAMATVKGSVTGARRLDPTDVQALIDFSAALSCELAFPRPELPPDVRRGQ